MTASFCQWLTKVGDFTVERLPCDTHLPQTVDLSAPPAAVLHTTEGNTIEDAMTVFKTHYAPHFLLGKDARGKVRILQLVSVGMKGASLENYNSLALVQVEMVSYSNDKLWLPDDNTLKVIASLMAACLTEYGIPLTHPWQDGDFGVYGKNPHRNSGKFGKVSGWFGHGDIPGNNHWDPGAIQWTKLLQLASTINHVVPDPISAPPRPGPTSVTIDTITKLQQALKTLHFDIVVDDDFGPQTIAAIHSYAHIKGIVETIPWTNISNLPMELKTALAEDVKEFSSTF